MLPVRRKFPTEAKTYTFDFTGKLPVGDSVPAQVPTMEIDAGVTASPASVDPASNSVSVRIRGGTVGQSYFVGATIITTGGEQLKLGLMVEITATSNLGA